MAENERVQQEHFGFHPGVISDLVDPDGIFHANRAFIDTARDEDISKIAGGWGRLEHVAILSALETVPGSRNRRGTSAYFEAQYLRHRAEVDIDDEALVGKAIQLETLAFFYSMDDRQLKRLKSAAGI